MIAYFDLFSGISGDMTLGALIDLGVPVDWLQKELSKLLGGFELKTETVYRQHLRATDLVVEIDGQDHSSRNYRDIRALIEDSHLPGKVKVNSLAAFKKIAEAESLIHGRDIETVHFHEIGGIDSIVDMVGSFLGIEYLGIDKIYSSAVPLGSGFVDCAHGKIPVPVPATMEILKGVPVVSSDARTEIVTPTGAAIITTLTGAFGDMPQMAVKKTGYGAGKRETGSASPNLLRIITGNGVAVPGDHPGSIQREQVCVVRTNVDDMSPEVSGFIMEQLFEKSALDVCFFPVTMKKNRPGIQIEVMCQQKDLDGIINLILTESTSIGVRLETSERAFLYREKARLETRFGMLEVKKITNPDGSSRFVPEYEEAKNVAKERKLPLKDVYTQILSDSLDRN